MEIDESVTAVTTKDSPTETSDAEVEHPKRKRKRDNDDLEGVYLQRLAQEEEKEEAQRLAERKNKRQKQIAEKMGVDGSGNASDAEEVAETAAKSDGEDVGEEEGASEDDFEIPQHESMAASKDETDVEKASRTVFLGNVATSAITSKSDKKTLLAHLSSFIAAMPTHKPPHKVESMRFRSIAFSSHVPKKAAFARKDIMDSTTKSTNAYVVYSTKQCAREAAQKLNGTVVLGRHLRVDEVAHPAKVDHRRCVFVGNLGFVDDESQMKAAAAEAEGAKKPRKSLPSDVEEGLWQQFGKAGTVESVRVVRDPKTRVGKGFAYVQFTVSQH